MKEFEDIIKRDLEIPFCSLEGISNDIAAEIIIGFTQMYRDYPFFKNVICAIESAEDCRDHINMLEFSDINYPVINCKYEEFNELFDDEFLWIFTFTQYSSGHFYHDKNEKDNYYSFIIDNKIKERSSFSKFGYSYDLIDRVAIYHEFGHLLDTFLNISNSNEFKSVIKNHDIKNEISEYACFDERELFAEAFSFYSFNRLFNDNFSVNGISHKLEKRVNKITPLITQLGNLANEKYKCFVMLNQLNFMRERYNFKKSFDYQRVYELKHDK